MTDFYLKKKLYSYNVIILNKTQVSLFITVKLYQISPDGNTRNSSYEEKYYNVCEEK